MTDNVSKLYTKEAAKNPDAVLEQAVGSYGSVLVAGWDVDGVLDIRASTNLSHADIVLLAAKTLAFLVDLDSLEVEVE